MKTYLLREPKTVEPQTLEPNPAPRSRQEGRDLWLARPR